VTASQAAAMVVIEPDRDYFKEAVAALKDAASIDSRHKRSPGNAGLLRKGVEGYAKAAELLECAIAPASKKVSERTKTALKPKLATVQKRLADLRPKLAALPVGFGRIPALHPRSELLRDSVPLYLKRSDAPEPYGRPT
jgi:hypothetical protein